ncbi:MAG: DUF1449 family protein [Flavobacteriaceae bacterium]|nr:DUF1449 family protein [Flavobacteriaceae bacterium]
MDELLNIAFSPVNALLSIMLILMMFYWLLTIFTGIDLDFFDIDFDVDVDAEVDVDADVDSKVDVDLADKNVNTEGGESLFIQFLRFFGFDELPFMFLLSVVIFVMWFLSVNINHYLNITSSLIGFLLLIPILFVSLFVAKYTTKPLAKLYRMINQKGEEEIEFLGRQGKVTSSVGNDKLGQIEILVKGDPIRVYAKGHEGSQIGIGEEVEVINESKDGKYYIIKRLNTHI